jgi:hypothetical protein
MAAEIFIVPFSNIKAGEIGEITPMTGGAVSGAATI